MSVNLGSNESSLNLNLSLKVSLLRAMECFRVHDNILTNEATETTGMLSKNTDLMLDITASLCDILLKTKPIKDVNQNSGDALLNPINTLTRILSEDVDLASLVEEQDEVSIGRQVINFSVKTSRIIAKCISNRLASYLLQRPDYNINGTTAIHQSSKLLERSMEKMEMNNKSIEHWTIMTGVIVAIVNVENNNSSYPYPHHQFMMDVALRCAFLTRGSVDWNSATAIVLCMMMTELSRTRILPQYWVSNYIASTDCKYFDAMRGWCRRMTTVTGEIYPPDKCESELEATIQNILLALHMLTTEEARSSSQVLKKCGLRYPSEVVPVMFAFDAIRNAIGATTGGVDVCIALAIQSCNAGYSSFFNKVPKGGTNHHRGNVPSYSPTEREHLQMSSFLITFWIGLWFQQQDEAAVVDCISWQTTSVRDNPTAPSIETDMYERIVMCLDSLASLPVVNIS